jgi:hypothetical protein
MKVLDFRFHTQDTKRERHMSHKASNQTSLLVGTTEQQITIDSHALLMTQQR